ncbi:RDD family protein [Rapidithrix thailandica]|uniref:RDD family protein n=1 Tax=Rapidithrix thailandica TaxID=413964 RepID=A0AAW9SHX1_9BACT
MLNTKPKQFVAHKIDENIQKRHLASFSNRLVAYAIDWALIILGVKYLSVAVLLFTVLVFVKGKTKRVLSQSRSLLNESLSKLDYELDKLDVEERVRKGFTNYLSVYIRFFIIFIYVVSIVVALGFVAGLIFPSSLIEYNKISEANLLMQPFVGVMSEVKIFAGFVGGLFYFALFTWKWNGQTPGKRFMKIRVTRLDGKKMSLWMSFERVSGYTASASLFLIGFFQVFWDRNHQTTHDKICETVVLYTSKEQKESPTPTS